MNQNEINSVRLVKIIKGHASSVRSLLLLEDKTIASCSTDKTIRIFEPNYYHCVKTITNNSVFSLCTIEDTNRPSNIIITNPYSSSILKLVSLSNKRIASISKSNKIQIWKLPNIPITELTGHSMIVYSLLYLEDKDVLLSGSLDKTLRLWNMSNYQCVTIINNVQCYSNNALYRIDNDRIIVGTDDKFSIVNINLCIIEKQITHRNFGTFRCFIKLRDNNTIICGGSDGKFLFYNMKTDQYTIMDNNHSDDINDLLLIDESTFMSCSSDTTIKLWNY